MHRRTINNILKRYKNCRNFEKSISLYTMDNSLPKSFFNEQSEHLLACCYSDSAYCLMEDGFPYFYDYGRDIVHAPSFHFDVHKTDNNFIYSPYNTLEECEKVLSKFIRNKSSLNLIIQMLNHISFQKNAYFNYRFNSKTEVNVINYTIGMGDDSFCFSLTFTDQSIIVNFVSQFNGERTSKDIFGNFDSLNSLCKQLFTATAIDFINFEELFDFNTDFTHFTNMAKIQKIYEY